MGETGIGDELSVCFLYLYSDRETSVPARVEASDRGKD